MGKSERLTKKPLENSEVYCEPANLGSGGKSPYSNVGVEAGSEGLNRRKFLILSGIAVGGGLATVFMPNPIKPLIFISKATGQLLQPSPQGITPTGLVNSVDASALTILDPLSIPKFENQLAAPPPVFQPKLVTSSGKVIRHEYTVTMSSFQEQILPQSMNLLTTVWGYGGGANDVVTGASLGFVQSSPGPTFEAVRGIPIKVTWQNNISSPYMLPVDPTIHWANPNNNVMLTSSFPPYPPGYPNAQSPVLLVTHLHGGQNHSTSDGGPTQWFTSDGKHGQTYYTYEKTDSNAAVYYYPNTQQPTTLWYHDHGLGVTRLNVLSGLAGFYLIRAPNDGSDKVAQLLPAGKYEMPLVIQDRTFNADGSLYYPSVGSVTDEHPYWVNSFLGNAIMVNEKAWPNMNVDRGQYRFRFLNGSNSRFYNISLSNGMSFIQIGSDGGYLQAPVKLTSFLLAPAERVDVIVDFSALAAGETVVLQNTIGETQPLTQIMQFTANASQGTTPFDVHAAPVPFNPTLPGSSFPTLPNPTKRRILTLYEIAGSNNLTSEALLDGQTWGAAVSEKPELGATEEWVIVNPTMDAHPIHLHLVQFQLVKRQTFSALSSYLKDWISLNGQPPFNNPTKNLRSLAPYLFTTIISPKPNEQAWKDTIIVNSGEVATIRVRFTAQDGSGFPFDATSGPGYVWHCHLLEHEDNEMMRPYQVVAPSQNPLIVPAAVTATGGAAAAALSLAYYYSRKRKKRAQQNVEAVNQAEPFFGQAETSQMDETEGTA